MLVVAAIGLFKHDNPTLAATFVFLGTVALIIAVFEPRMEGPQQLSPALMKINLAAVRKKAVTAERDLKAGTVVPLK
jgi:hypothetical protein